MNKRLNTFSLAWPIFIEMFLKYLVGYIGVFVLSKYSDAAVAAVGVCNQLNYLLIILYSVVNSGTSIIIVQYLGAGKKDYVEDIIWISLFVNFIFGVICSIVLVIFCPYILSLMGLKEEILIYGIQYLCITGSMSFIQSVSTTASSIIRAFKYTNISMYVMVIVNILNIIGSYISIFRPLGIPQFGVRGIAVSAVSSQFIGLIILLSILRHKIGLKSVTKLCSSNLSKIISEIYRLGTPSAGEVLVAHLSQLTITSIISLLGSNELITRTYVFNLLLFIMMFSNSIGQATQILVGHLVGAKDTESAYKIGIKNLKFAILLSGSSSIAFAVLGENLLNIFTHNQAVIQTGRNLLAISIILEIGRSFNLVIINALKGSGDVKFPVFIGIFTMWGCGVLFSYVLGIYFKLGLYGVWIAFCMDEWIRGIIVLRRWKSKKWIYKMVLTGSNDSNISY